MGFMEFSARWIKEDKNDTLSGSVLLTLLDGRLQFNELEIAKNGGFEKMTNEARCHGV